MHLVRPIAVKPYILKYIAHYYAIDPLVLNKNSKYGLFLWQCLSKPKLLKVVPADIKIQPPEEKKEIIDYKIFSAELPVMISENYWVKRGPLIIPERQYDFNKLVAYDFHEEFFKYVKNRIGPKGSINQAIFDFRGQFDISEDELSFKTIQRAFQRHNENVKASLSA